MQKIDLLGKKFGKWTIIGHIPREKCKAGKIKWICQCVCGTIINRNSNYIRNHWNATDCGCSITLVGKKFGNLTVIERLGKDSKHVSNYIVKCDCGKIKTYRGHYIISGIVISCGCKRKHSEKNNALRFIFYDYKKNAKKRNIEFSLDIKQVESLVVSECVYCGKSNSNKKVIQRSENLGDKFFLYNGIDRIDNSKGYTEQNTVTCCKLCNHMKWDLSFDEWKEHIKCILEFKKQK